MHIGFGHHNRTGVAQSLHHRTVPIGEISREGRRSRGGRKTNHIKVILDDQRQSMKWAARITRFAAAISGCGGFKEMVRIKINQRI